MGTWYILTVGAISSGRLKWAEAHMSNINGPENLGPQPRPADESGLVHLRAPAADLNAALIRLDVTKPLKLALEPYGVKILLEPALRMDPKEAFETVIRTALNERKHERIRGMKSLAIAIAGEDRVAQLDAQERALSLLAVGRIIERATDRREQQIAIATQL